MSAYKRSIYSELEKQVFLDILKKFKHIIESKATNSYTLKDKSEAWSIITEEYNSSSLISTKRDIQQLKKYWSNLKQQNKNLLTAERQSRFLTGGGPEKTSGEVDPDVMEIIPDLMRPSPSISSSNYSKNEATDRQREVLKAIQRNDMTKIADISTDKYYKTKSASTSSCNDEPASNISIIMTENINNDFEFVNKFIEESSNPDTFSIEKENEMFECNINKRKEDNLRSTSKKLKINRITSVSEKEMELATIKINHELKMCKLREQREEFINKLTEEKLLLEKKELQEKVKLAKFCARKEMGEDYVSDEECD